MFRNCVLCITIYCAVLSIIVPTHLCEEELYTQMGFCKEM